MIISNGQLSHNRVQHPLRVVPLADVAELSDLCIQLLNEEWPRSAVQRQNSMRKSLNRELPLALVLLDSNNSLLGHARICSLPQDREGVWVESVVIWKQLRGQGLGKLLMEHTEQWVREHGFAKIFLSTTDKKEFYARCGFSPCAPVINFGANTNIFRSLGGIFGPMNSPHDDRTGSSAEQKLTIQKEQPNIVPAPPPPPPKKPLSKCDKIYMVKRINL